MLISMPPAELVLTSLELVPGFSTHDTEYRKQAQRHHNECHDVKTEQDIIPPAEDPIARDSQDIAGSSNRGQALETLVSAIETSCSEL